jgi:hypothetical protein
MVVNKLLELLKVLLILRKKNYKPLKNFRTNLYDLSIQKKFGS